MSKIQENLNRQIISTAEATVESFKRKILKISELQDEVERLKGLIQPDRWPKDGEITRWLSDGQRLGWESYTPPSKSVVWVNDMNFIVNEDGKHELYDGKIVMIPSSQHTMLKHFGIEVRVWHQTCDTCGQVIP